MLSASEYIKIYPVVYLLKADVTSNAGRYKAFKSNDYDESYVYDQNFTESRGGGWSGVQRKVLELEW